MLYDPKWEKTVKADPFTLESLIAWLEQQPAEKTYSYVDPDNCMLCQYFTAMGFKNPSIAWNTMDHDDGSVDFPRVFHWTIANDDACTFGAALSRAREALA